MSLTFSPSNYRRGLRKTGKILWRDCEASQQNLEYVFSDRVNKTDFTEHYHCEHVSM